jgi:threonine aldolase
VAGSRLNRLLDFRSDASSPPTSEIRRAMADALVGNDDFGDDPTVNRLEEEGARLLGKEAALFVHSGTMANMTAVMAHIDPGATVVVGERFHIFDPEGEAMTRVAGIEFLPVADRTCRGRTRLLIEEVVIRAQPVGLLCLENSVSRPGGTLIEMAHMQELTRWAQGHGMPVHLDGARLFNASLGLGVEPPQLASCADSVALGLTKGPSAPCGGLLAGSAELIAKARHNRWMLGGNWKQGGIVAAGCLVALEQIGEGMAQDHENARRLAIGLDAIDGLAVDVDDVVTNILYMTVTEDGFDLDTWSDYVALHGVLAGPFQPHRICRWVTHPGIGADDVERALQIAASAAVRALA